MDDVEAITERLIAFDSRSQVGNSAIADFLASYLEPITRRLERIEYRDENGEPKVALVAMLGSGEGGLALCAHMDTVPAQGWDTDPFQPRKTSTRLYGLGACDMKGPLASTLVAALSYPSLKARKPLTLIYTADEEAGKEAARRIVEDSEILASTHVEYAIIAEPTELQVVHAHKSDILFTITAEGEAAHSSTGEGLNANLKMIPFLQDMWDIYHELRADKSYGDADFNPPYPDWNIMIDNFGCAPNITVPTSQCRIKFRYTKKQDPRSLISRVGASAKSHGLELSYHLGGEPLYTSPDSPVVRYGLELVGQERPRSVSYGTDACVLGSAFPCIVFGPGSIRQAHTSNEWISREQLRRSVGLYRSFIQEFCN